MTIIMEDQSTSYSLQRTHSHTTHNMRTLRRRPQRSLVVKVLLEQEVRGEVLVLLAGEVGLDDESLGKPQSF